MASIEDTICDAIEVIVDRAVETAGYDKTVQATIVSCVDATVGKYKCRYQDSVFYAYSTSSDVTYTDGTSVYVLVPGNDMSQDKTILGATKKLGVDYVSVVEGENAYEVVGTNVISSTGTFTFSSYKAGTQIIMLYSKDNAESDNLIYVDTTAVQEYFPQGEVIICGGVFRTDLPTEQQYRGNYGLLFALDFVDNTENQVVTRYYTVDVDNMTGNPYKLITDTRQYGIFDIDAENFIEINYISAFCYDFPNSLPDEECVDDIFISGIEMSAANRLSDDELASYVLTFVTPQGTYFMQGALDSDTLEIDAQVRVKGQVIDNSSQSLSFYWGIEHVGVTSQSEYYCKYLGQGWKCLNDYNIIEQNSESDPMVVEWVPGGYRFYVKKSDFLAKQATYKCAVIYDNVVLTKTITIKNYDAEYEITIESDCGTQFYFDIGYPTLTCICLKSGQPTTDTLNYSWAVTNNVGTFSSIAETPELNADYAELYAEYTQLVADIASGAKLPAANADLLAGLERSLKDYETIMRVEANVIYHLNVNTITTFSTYQCTVYLGNDYVGTGSIVLLNSLETEGVYSLVINDGCYVYKYNEMGISPASNAVDSPISIKALTFTIFDNLGQAIEDEIAQHCDIQWVVPTENTLLKIPSTYDDYLTSVNSDGTVTYTGLMTLPYSIADRYDITKQNNDIRLTVLYQDLSLSAKTNLTFTKEGENGTNGTEYTLKILPNTSNPLKYWIITDTNGTYTHNFTPVSGAGNRFLKFQMYHNENLIFDGVTGTQTSEGKAMTVTWSMQQNKYTSSVSDDSSLSVTADGVFTINGYRTNHPANIVKLTVVSEGVTYYVTYPVITVSISDSSYRLNPKEGAGFQYAIYSSDGRSPQYDNTNPFEVIVERLISGYWEDVSRMTNSYEMSYEWSYLGRIYDYTTGAWVTQENLLDRYRYDTDNYDACQHAVKPADGYDGQCVTNAVRCVVKLASSGATVAEIHMPVHLYLNRYGLASLNGWDGNSIQIDAEGGFILAPQIGAGMKESDNSFTGIVMGVVRESNKNYNKPDIGLIGYHEGVRTLFLDAQTGKAVFGAYGAGQIVIDPSSNKALIYSGTYWDEDHELTGTGMLIDLTTPEIRFGSGNFSVDSRGYITAIGGGEIAGFLINSNNLWTKVDGHEDEYSYDYRYNFRISSSSFERSINGIVYGAVSDPASGIDTDIGCLVLASSNNFAVSENGKMFAAYGVIGDGDNKNKIYIDHSDTNSTASAIHTANMPHFQTASDKTTDPDTGERIIDNGFYLGTDGFCLGKEFSVDSDGHVTIIGPDNHIEITDDNGDEVLKASKNGIQLGDYWISSDESYTFESTDKHFQITSGYFWEDWEEEFEEPLIVMTSRQGNDAYNRETVLGPGGLRCSQVVAYDGTNHWRSHFYNIILHGDWWQGMYGNPNMYNDVIYEGAEGRNHDLQEDLYVSLNSWCAWVTYQFLEENANSDDNYDNYGHKPRIQELRELIEELRTYVDQQIERLDERISNIDD